MSLFLRWSQHGFSQPVHGAASWYQLSQEERPAGSIWPASQGSPYSSAGNEGSFSPAIASFSPQPVPDSPLLCNSSKPLYFWTPCHSSQLYQAQQWHCALCGLQGPASGPTCLFASVVVPETCAVAAGQEGASLQGLTGHAEPVQFCPSLLDKCLFSPCESKGTIPGAVCGATAEQRKVPLTPGSLSGCACWGKLSPRYKVTSW